MNWRLVTKLKLKNELREIFNKHDPIGIYRDKETNFDEYDPEIEQLPLVFNKTSSVKEFADKLHEIFQRMFSKETAGKKANYRELAKDVYKLLMAKND